jgi:hypothetical protein
MVAVDVSRPGSKKVKFAGENRLNQPVTPDKSMTPDPPQWKIITPERLHAAIEHMRSSFELGCSGGARVTEKFCHLSLHPNPPNLKSLSAYNNALQTYLLGLRRSEQDEFEEFLSLGTPPGIFRAYFDLYYRVILFHVQGQFDSTLKIGLANRNALNAHPVEWAKSHLDLLINDRKVSIERWVKNVCDVQELPEPELIPSQFEEIVFWRNWRAPKLIYMHPAGNAAYDAATSWAREDEKRTLELLANRSRRFVEFLALTLEQLAGAAHVGVAQDKEYAGVSGNMPAKDGSAQSFRREIVKPHSEESARALLPTYQSPIRRAILMQLLANPGATGIEICRQLDAYGDVELPEQWKTREPDRLFAFAYQNATVRSKIEVMISKIRGALRERGLIPPRQ